MVVVLGTGVLLLGKIAMTLLRGFKMYIFFFKKRYLIFTFIQDSRHTKSIYRFKRFWKKIFKVI